MRKKEKVLRISVIIPVYNSEGTILKCLKALQKQTLKPIEIIVVDDGSTDKTKSKIQKAIRQPADKMKNLIFLRQDHQGVSRARNLGAQKAKGEILAFTDSDCVPPPDWLEKIALAFADADVGAVGGGYNSGADNSFWQRFSHEELVFRRQKRTGPVSTLVSNNMACRKECFDRAGGFPVEYSVCEDMLLTFKISRQSKVLWFKDNKVQHHFKKSLKGFLRHQYDFGKRSTQFFLENPAVLASGHHQGRSLHLAMAFSLFALTSFGMAVVFLLLGNLWAGKFLLGVSASLLLGHLLLYLGFALHLQKAGFSTLETAKSYSVSLLRDLICGPSFFDGIFLFLNKKRGQVKRQ